MKINIETIENCGGWLDLLEFSIALNESFHQFFFELFLCSILFLILLVVRTTSGTQASQKLVKIAMKFSSLCQRRLEDHIEVITSSELLWPDATQRQHWLTTQFMNNIDQLFKSFTSSNQVYFSSTLYSFNKFSLSYFLCFDVIEGYNNTNGITSVLFWELELLFVHGLI